MTELAIHNGSSLAITGEQEYWSDKQLAALRQLGVTDATSGDLAVFFHQAQRTGLDPFAKQLYLIGRWSQQGTKYTIQTGIDGYRLIARRAVDRSHEALGYDDTVWCGPDGQWFDVWLSVDPPAAAKVTVIRNGQRFPAVALWSEYVQTVKDKKTGEYGPNSMWQRMGANQLAKCAEALALRKAFPQDLSGIYTTDEMGQAENHAPPRTQERPPSIQQAIADQGPAHFNVEAAANGEPAWSHPESDLRTDAQSKRLAVLLRELDLDKDRDAAFGQIAAWIDRDITSTKELTKAEASTVIDELAAMVAAGVDAHTGEVVDADVVDEWPAVAPVPA